MTKVNLPHYIFPKATELIKLKKFAKTLEFKKSLSTSQLAGQWQSIFKGRSMDFDEVRLYQSGDDIRSIDWKISAKTSKLHTQVYKEEKERPILLAIDYCCSMHFGTRKKFKCTLAAEIASILAFSLIKKGDRVGGLIFDDQNHKEVRPKMQTSGVLQLIFHLTQPMALSNEVNNNGEGGLNNAIKRLNRLAKPGMSIFIISDFLNLNEQSKKNLIRISRHCHVNLCLIYDPLEEKIPKADLSFESEGKSFFIASDKKQQKSHQDYFKKRKDEVQTLARRKRFTFSSISTNDELAKFNLKMT